jgi:hypothetical protein
MVRGVAVDSPLPLPLMRVSDLPHSACRADLEREAALAWTNFIVVVVNFLHTGREEISVCFLYVLLLCADADAAEHPQARQRLPWWGFLVAL